MLRTKLYDLLKVGKYRCELSSRQILIIVVAYQLKMDLRIVSDCRESASSDQLDMGL